MGFPVFDMVKYLDALTKTGQRQISVMLQTKAKEMGIVIILGLQLSQDWHPAQNRDVE